MKITLPQKAFQAAVSWAASSVPARPNRAVLGTILVSSLSGSDTLVGFGATDDEVTTKQTVSGSVEEHGSVCVSGQLLANIAAALPDNEVKLVAEGTKLILTCGSAKFTLPTLSASDAANHPCAKNTTKDGFAALPGETGQLDAAAFSAKVNTVALAAATKPGNQPALMGVQFSVSEGKLTLAATDKYRMAVSEMDWSSESDAELSALVPAAQLVEAAKGFAKLTGKVRIGLSVGAEGNLAAFGAGERILTTRILDGAGFPRWKDVLPKSATSTAQVGAGELTEVLKRVGLVAADTAPAKLGFEAEKLSVSAGAADTASAAEELGVVYTGEELTIAFNPKLLRDGLSVITGEVAQFSFNGPQKPVIITGADAGYRYLLMPVRLS